MFYAIPPAAPFAFHHNTVCTPYASNSNERTTLMPPPSRQRTWLVVGVFYFFFCFCFFVCVGLFFGFLLFMPNHLPSSYDLECALNFWNAPTDSMLGSPPYPSLSTPETSKSHPFPSLLPTPQVTKGIFVERSPPKRISVFFNIVVFLFFFFPPPPPPPPSAGKSQDGSSFEDV